MAFSWVSKHRKIKEENGSRVAIISDHSHARTYTVLGCLGVLLILAAVAVLWLVPRYVSHDTPADKKRADNQKLASLEKQSTTNTTNAQFEQTASAWKAYAATTPSLAHKKIALEEAGAMDMSSGNFSQAVVDYKAASVIQALNYTEAAALAQAYIRLGQNTAAINYLQQALRLMPTNLDGWNAQRAYDKQEIQKLGES